MANGATRQTPCMAPRQTSRRTHRRPTPHSSNGFGYNARMGPVATSRSSPTRRSATSCHAHTGMCTWAVAALTRRTLHAPPGPAPPCGPVSLSVVVRGGHRPTARRARPPRSHWATSPKTWPQWRRRLGTATSLGATLFLSSAAPARPASRLVSRGRGLRARPLLVSPQPTSSGLSTRSCPRRVCTAFGATEHTTPPARNPLLYQATYSGVGVRSGRRAPRARSHLLARVAPPCRHMGALSGSMEAPVSGEVGLGPAFTSAPRPLRSTNDSLPRPTRSTGSVFGGQGTFPLA